MQASRKAIEWHFSLGVQRRPQKIYRPRGTDSGQRVLSLSLSNMSEQSFGNYIMNEKFAVTAKGGLLSGRTIKM